MYHLGCNTFVAFGEHRTVIRSYGTAVVIGVARYCLNILEDHNGVLRLSDNVNT